MSSPLISIVIPTYQRSTLVLRALRSALAQTVEDIEAIVVVDGRDAETCQALSTIRDRRVRVQVPDRHLGNTEARNFAIRSATAEYVAFLDDDDEWIPRKLELQLAAVRRSRWKHPIVSCRMIARSEVGDAIRPRRAPRPDEPLSEYFFCRRTPFTGEGMVINSPMLTSRELMHQVPFRTGLARHFDPDWILRATQISGVGLELVPQDEPLVIWHIERDRSRITNDYDWRGSLAYAHANRDLFTARAYAAFVLHVIGSAAAAQKDRRAFFILFREAFKSGHPAPVDMISHVGNFVLPLAMQHRTARLFARMTNGRHRATYARGQSR